MLSFSRASQRVSNYTYCSYPYSQASITEFHLHLTVPVTLVRVATEQPVLVMSARYPSWSFRVLPESIIRMMRGNNKGALVPRQTYMLCIPRPHIFRRPTRASVPRERSSRYIGIDPVVEQCWCVLSTSQRANIIFVFPDVPVSVVVPLGYSIIIASVRPKTLTVSGTSSLSKRPDT